MYQFKFSDVSLLNFYTRTRWWTFYFVLSFVFVFGVFFFFSTLLLYHLFCIGRQAPVKLQDNSRELKEGNNTEKERNQRHAEMKTRHVIKNKYSYSLFRVRVFSISQCWYCFVCAPPLVCTICYWWLRNVVKKKHKTHRLAKNIHRKLDWIIVNYAHYLRAPERKKEIPFWIQGNYYDFNVNLLCVSMQK